MPRPTCSAPCIWASRFLGAHLDAGYSSAGWTMGIFSMGLKMGRLMSFGTSLRAWISPTDHDRMHGLVGWDVALHLHPGQYVSFFAAVYDLNAPSKGGMHPLSVERTWGVGLAVRPLGRDFFTFTVDNFIGERSGNDTLRLSLEVEPVRGIGIVATASLLFGEQYPLSSERSDTLHDVQVSLALRLDLAHVGVWGGTHLSALQAKSGLGGTPVVGWSLGVRFSGQKHKTLLMPSRYVTVELDGAAGPGGIVAAVLRLEYLRRDPKVKGVVLEPRGFAASTGAIQDLREAVERLREAGKHVVCHADEITSSAYYLCTAADRIYLGPAGGVRLSGYRMRILFFTGLLQKLGVNAQFVKVGEYKSYPEKFTLKAPSEPALEQYTELLEDVWSQVVADVAAGRGMEAGEVEELLERGPFNAEEAVTGGLADGLAYEDELVTMIEEDTGSRVLLDRKYWKVAVKPSMWAPGSKKVALLTIGGSLVEGKSRSIPLLGMRLAGDETIVKALKRARMDPTITAVVLRVDSGGGSSLASERIWRQVQRLAEKKPVVVSMGGAAASGGYYIAAPATEVIANPSSVTGSIGIFYGKADLSGLLSKLGVNVTVVKEGSDRVDMDSWHRPYTQEEVAFLQKQIEHFYNIFLSRVSAGRGMTKKEVDALGRGRVWSGTRAKDKGLVDRIGGLATAIDRARALGKVPEWVPIIDITPGPSLFEKIVGQFMGVKQKSSASDLAAMVARAAGLDDIYPLALFLLREE
ncbi:MAG: signal peptide peptidase SppA, partial [Deltaproteobacteria bacterium]|nr:signal peptide peptidase SppA [Deltaproteobacteria bacterium]